MRWLITPYDLPLRRAWPGIGAGRRGWIVRIADGDLTGYGDCAPLPALGTEDFDEAAKALGDTLPHVAIGVPPSEVAAAFPPAEHLARWRAWCRGAPAAACAVDTALCDLAARAAGRPLAEWLDGAAAKRVRVSSVLERQGDAPVKLKLPPDLGEALRLIEMTPGPLRLDANRGYSFDDAAALLRAVRDLTIDHVEEPLRHPTLPALAALQALVPFPIALDESLLELDLDAVLHSDVRRLVLKPVLLGGPLRTLDIARRVRQAGIEAVVTTALDSAVGAWMAAHVAAAVNNGLAHGLDTSRWLAEDVAAGPAARDGWLEMPERPGLGVEA